MVAMQVPDKLCIVTYLSQYYNHFRSCQPGYFILFTCCQSLVYWNILQIISILQYIHFTNEYHIFLLIELKVVYNELLVLLLLTYCQSSYVCVNLCILEKRKCKMLDGW